MPPTAIALGALLPLAAPSAQETTAPPTAAPEPVVLRHVAAAPGTRTTFSFTEESDLAVQHLRSTMNGGVFERDAPDRSVKHVARRVWVDATRAEEERTILRRSFAELGATMDVTNHRDGAPKPDGRAVAGSTLQGRGVEFVHGGTSASVRLLEEEGGEAGTPISLLDLGLLLQDCSLREFLPPKGGAVSVGDRWTVSPDAMLGVFAPGGDVRIQYGAIEGQIDPDVIARFGGHAVSCFGSGIQGEVEAELREVVPTDGGPVAVIGLCFDVRLQRDPAEWMRIQSEPFEMAKIGQTAKNATHAMTVAGEATLRWDLRRHRFLDFEATAQSTSDQRLDYEFTMRGTDFHGEEHFEFRGTTKLRLSAKHEDSP